MHEVIVLLPGYSTWTREGKQRAGGTVTLIRGAPNLIVDTGAPEQRDQLLAALSRVGLEPATIEYVILTHGHLDHVGNNNIFPAATFILESDIGCNGEYWLHDFKREPLAIAARDGSPPIEIVATPGHTDHDRSVLVRTADGLVAIVGDLFGHDRDWVDDLWHEFTQDKTAQARSREQIFQLADYIVPGHGPMFKVTK